MWEGRGEEGQSSLVAACQGACVPLAGPQRGRGPGVGGAGVAGPVRRAGSEEDGRPALPESVTVSWENGATTFP